MIKRNYICDHIGCNRVFNAPNHLKQHKERKHIKKANNFDYLSCNNQVDVNVDVDFEIDESDTEEICNINFIIPPIILNNPTLESLIPDIGLNINNPDFLHNDEPISIYSNYQEKILSNFKYNKNILHLDIDTLEQFLEAILDPTIFEEILIKHVGYVQLYDLNFSESVGQNVLKFSNLRDHFQNNGELLLIS